MKAASEGESERESVTLCDCEHYPKISFGPRLLWMDANKPVLPFVDSFLDWCGLHFPFSKLKFSSKLTGITSSKAQYAAGNALRKIVAPSKWAEGKERGQKKSRQREGESGREGERDRDSDVVAAWEIKSVFHASWLRFCFHFLWNWLVFSLYPTNSSRKGYASWVWIYM